MTKDEFIDAYCAYSTHDKVEARALAEQVNEAGVDGETVVAVEFDGVWCLMLERAYLFVKELGI